MNEQIMQGITSLSNLAPSAADQRRVQLESTLSSAITRMAQYTAMGRSTDVISQRIERLETELDAHTDAMFSL
jgi:predicted  nucleic acid-binding Zn-ribbon protein